MYNFKSTLFLYKFMFVAEIFLVELVIGLMFKKKDKFPLRIALVALFLAAITFALPIVVYESWYLTVLFIVMFAVSVALMKFLYDEPFMNLFVSGVFAYSAQHISYSIASYIVNIAGDGYKSVYTEENFTANDIRSFVTSTCVYLAVLGGVYAYVLLTGGERKGMKVNKFSLVAIAASMIIANVILNAVAVYEFEKDFSKSLFTVFFVYDALTAAMVVWLLFFAITYDKLRDEMQVLSVLRNREKQNYTIKKERIDAVNVMCHDLKHQIERLRKNAYEDSVLSEMERSLDSCANVYKTGSYVLDIVMSESALVCGGLGIKLICIADGSSLSKINENALFSIFDNLVNNAVDAARKVEKESERYVKVVVAKQMGGVINISVENSFASQAPVFEDGLPKSTEKGGLHGYGLRSVKMAVDNLDGAMKIFAADGVFRVIITLPQDAE